VKPGLPVGAAVHTAASVAAVAPEAMAGAASVRQRHIAALARRAALQHGAVRLLLDERLRALQAALDAAPEPCAPARPGLPAARQHGSPLAELLASLAPPDAAPGAADVRPGHPRPTQAPRELKALRDYRSTWSRLAVEQRVHQALARVPANAGPLNTQRLVHQALTALRDASPPYLHRLVAQVEALLWLEQLGQGGPAGAATRKPGAAASAAVPTGSARS
jgi:Protein of unknown function (DUF2894)